MFSTNQIANYILWSVSQLDDPITNLRLQKLVYYAQAWHLALYDKPLFDAPIEARERGSIQPDLWERFKEAEWRPVNCTPYFDGEKPDLPIETKEHLDEVMDVFLGYSSVNLETMIQNETPWKNAWSGTEKDQDRVGIISHEDMREFYGSVSNEN